MESEKKPVGGARKGGGRKKGGMNYSTITKIQARDALAAIVIAELQPLVAAQIASAKGIRHTFLRDEGGRFVQLTDPKQIEQALNSGDEGKYYWTFTKDPHTPAFTDLMNRTLDKPAEQRQEIEISGSVTIEDKLRAARARVAQRKDEK